MAFLEKKGVERLWQHTVNKINEVVSGLDIQDEIYIGTGELPEGYTLQINPEGDAAILESLPVPSIEKAGQVIKVQADGTYGLAEDLSGLTEVSASNVSSGIFQGQVQANETATTELATAQVRNVVILNTDPGVGATVDYPDGTVVHVYESTV